MEAAWATTPGSFHSSIALAEFNLWWVTAPHLLAVFLLVFTLRVFISSPPETEEEKRA